MIKKHIPNAITCANLFFGCIGIMYIFENKPETAAYCILLAAVFDFFDGMVARWLDVKSEIGKQLDSLADMVSFGVVPAFTLFHLMKNCVDIPNQTWAMSAFLVAVFSALRLAKFNIDTRQTVDFIGLNTPTNTLFVISLPFIQKQYPALLSHWWIFLLVTLICSGLLVSELRFFSLKLNKDGWKRNIAKFILIIISAVCIAFLKFAAVPLILVCYIFLSQIHFKINK